MTHVTRSMPFDKLGRLVALAALIVGLLVASAGTAHAHGQAHEVTTEGFEAPHSDLVFYSHGTGSGWLENNFLPYPVHPHGQRSGAGDAYLKTRSAGSWAAVQRKVTKTANAGCLVEAYVHPMEPKSNVYFANNARIVHIDVLDAATWQHKIIAHKAFSVSGSSYQRLELFFMAPNPGVTPVAARVLLSDNGSGKTNELRVDDLKVDCAYIH